MGYEHCGEKQAHHRQHRQKRPAGALGGLENLAEREGARDLVDGVPERAYAGGGLDLLAEAGVVPHVGVEVGLGALLAEPGFLLDLGGAQLVRLVEQADLVCGEEGQDQHARDCDAGGQQCAHLFERAGYPARVLIRGVSVRYLRRPGLIFWFSPACGRCAGCA